MVSTLDFEHLEDDTTDQKLLADGRSSPIGMGLSTSLDRVSAFHTITTEDGTSTEEFTKVVKDLEDGKVMSTRLML